MPHAKPPSDRLADVYRQLQQAMELNDWQAIGSASQAVRALLDELPPVTELSTRARQLRERLGVLHSEALERCRRECERLREVLNSHTEYAEGRSAYMQIEGLVGEDT